MTVTEAPIKLLYKDLIFQNSSGNKFSSNQ